MLPATEKGHSCQWLDAKRRERKEATLQQERGRIKQKNIIDALSNMYVVDDNSF